MDPETHSFEQGRRRQSAIYWLTECVMALLFLGALMASQAWSTGEQSVADVALALLPVLVITVWGGLAARRVLALEEFERRVAVNALAISLLVTVWLVTVWSLLAQFAGIPPFASIFIAPVAAAIWQVSWFVLRARYL